MSVLRQPAVTYPGKTELPLDDAELVFHLRPHPGLVAFPRTLRLRQLAVERSLRLGEILRIRRRLQDHGFLTRIGRVPPCLTAMQMVGQNPRIVGIGRFWRPPNESACCDCPRRYAPSCRSTTACLCASAASPDPVFSSGSSSNSVRR